MHKCQPIFIRQFLMLSNFIVKLAEIFNLLTTTHSNFLHLPGRRLHGKCSINTKVAFSLQTSLRVISETHAH